MLLWIDFLKPYIILFILLWTLYVLLNSSVWFYLGKWNIFLCRFWWDSWKPLVFWNIQVKCLLNWVLTRLLSLLVAPSNEQRDASLCMLTMNKCSVFSIMPKFPLSVELVYKAHAKLCWKTKNKTKTTSKIQCLFPSGEVLALGLSKF